MKKLFLSLAFVLCMALVSLNGYAEKSTPVKQQFEIYAVSTNLP